MDPLAIKKIVDGLSVAERAAFRAVLAAQENPSSLLGRTDPTATSQSVERTKVLYQLWIADNNVLNVKLAQFLTVTAILVASLSYFHALTDATARKPISGFGVAFSLFWMFSLLRTVVHRDHWKALIKDTASAFDVLPQPKELPLYGRLDSAMPAWILPALVTVFWGIVF